MPYKTIFGDTFENEFDEEMTRKFPQTYKVLKNIYPDAYKLPKDEIKTMSQMLRSQGETFDEATGLVQSHIKKNEPSWKLDYFDDNNQPGQDWLNNNFNQNLNNVDYGKAQSFQPYPNTNEYPQYQPNEFLPNGDINFSKVYERVQQEHPKPEYYDFNRYLASSLPEALNSFIKKDMKNFSKYKTKGYHDKYKHAMINCSAAQRGFLDEKLIGIASELKEVKDKIFKKNTKEESNQDMAANYIGRQLGYLHPNSNCSKLLAPYISKEYPYKWEK